MSATTRVELGIVAESLRGPCGTLVVNEFLDRYQIDVVAVDATRTDRAVAAWRRFGKGRHPAALNFGDCFAYALATELAEPLLFTGDDFGRTDVESALSPDP